MSVKKILIIDDEEAFCKIIQKGFEGMGGFNVEMAFNGEDGIKKASAGKPDIILLDIKMPGLSGIETLERLKSNENTVEIPVIMLTALDDDELRKKAAQWYDDEYLIKPVDIFYLKNKINLILQKRGIL